MPAEPVPRGGHDGEEPERSTPAPGYGSGPHDHTPGPGNKDSSPAGDGPAPRRAAAPGDGREEPPAVAPEDQQGLFVCLPAENMELSRFGGDGQAPPMAPGPLLAMVAAAVSGGDGTGLAQVPEEVLFAVISGGRRMASWATWLEFSAMRELALRHPAVPPRPRPARPAGPAGPAAPATQDGAATPEPATPEPATPEPATPEPATPEPATPEPAAPKPPAAGAAATGSAGAASGAAAVPDPAYDGRVQFADFVADEVSFELRMSWHGTADRISYACDLAGRLPVTFAALGAGLIDPVRAKIIYEQTDILSAADAAKADPVLAAAAQQKTYAELRAAAARLVLKLDPDSHERRKQARRKREAHVRPFREESGNAGIIARELPADEVLASWQNVEQRALDLRAAGMPGTLRELRCRAYFDLLQERDSRLAAGPAQDQDQGQDRGPGDGDGPPDGPGGNDGNGGNGPLPHGGPAGTGPGGRARPAPKDTGPVLAALVNITVPLATALGQSGTPGEAAGFGLLDAATARDLLAAAARSPQTRWCVTVLHPDGTAAAHGCATGQHPGPPGPEPPGPEPPGGAITGGAASGSGPPGTANLGTTCDSGGGPDQRPPPQTRAQDYLRSLRVRLTPIARGSCDHRQAETGYRPSRKLRHLVTTRSTRCSAPGCGRPAARCDLDHTVAWDKGGLTCECDLAPLCRHHHRCKQAEGWQLTQPEPGLLQWRTPNGRTYATTPTEYAV